MLQHVKWREKNLNMQKFSSQSVSTYLNLDPVKLQLLLRLLLIVKLNAVKCGGMWTAQHFFPLAVCVKQVPWLWGLSNELSPATRPLNHPPLYLPVPSFLPSQSVSRCFLSWSVALLFSSVSVYCLFRSVFPLFSSQFKSHQVCTHETTDHTVTC